jgi:hypothetical protein
MTSSEKEYHELVPDAPAGTIVNLFPADLAKRRAEALLTEYRRRLDHPSGDGPPAWYCRAAITELEALAADRRVAA